LLVTLVLHGYERAKNRWKRNTLPSPERRALLQTVTAPVIAAAGISTYGTYSAFMGPEVTETVVRLRGLPKSLEGFTIAQLTDVHVGPVIQSAFLKTLVAKTNALKPDLTVITGDLVDGRVERLSGFVRELAALQARNGVCFITGNHDYYSGADEWCDMVSALGFNVLRNRNISVDGLRIIGVDDLSAARFGEGGYDLEKAMTGVRVQDEPTVLLAHQPGSFDDAVARHIGLQISGHTHGGQMFPATLGAYAIWGKHSRGLSTTGDSHLYVSRGCGFVGPPFRVGSPPEIAKIVLVSG
jgi:predicted MPP superfamily phosphohydrolase